MDSAIERTLSGMSLERKVGQLLAPRALSHYAPADGEAFRRLLSLVEDVGVGGFVFFQGDVFGQSILAGELQLRAEIPLLLSQDAEWGVGMRLPDTTTFPNMMGIAASRDEALAYQVGAVTAVEAKALGVYHVFAPTADVNNNAANPIINVRSFGEDPELVARMVVAVINGLQDHGVIATAKHFPGHGDTAVDSHSDLPVLGVSRERLDEIELVPFRAALHAGVQSVMVGHLALPKLGDSPDLPASLSPRIVTGLLREDLGFDGLVVSDAMDMMGIQNHYSADEAAVMAIEAGVDMLLTPPDEHAAWRGIVRAVETGRLPEDRIDDSVRRILKSKGSVGLADRAPSISVSTVRESVGNTRHRVAADSAAASAITLLRNDGGTIPLKRRESMYALVLSDQTCPSGVGKSLIDALASQVGQVDATEIGTQSGPQRLEDCLERVAAYDVLVVAAFVAVRSFSGKIGLPTGYAALLKELFESKPRSVLISFGSPYIISEVLPLPGAYLAAFSGSRPSQRAIARVLLGEASVGGRLPIAIPGVFDFGAGLDIGPGPAV